MIVTPTLHFHEKCEEAITLYQKAFDCKVDTLLHFSDANKRDLDGELPAEQKNLVMHSVVFIGNQRIRMSDGLAVDNVPVNSIFLTITFDSADEVKRSFDILKDAGGKIVEPLHSTTFSSCMGSVIDKYGFRWRLMVE